MINPFRLRSDRKGRRRTLRSEKRSLRLPSMSWLQRFGVAVVDRTVRVYRRSSGMVVDAFNVFGSTIIRSFMSPFESLVTVTLDDHVLRIVVTRGYRVTWWSEVELPAGVVKDGLIVDSPKFEEILDDAIEPIVGGFHVGDRRLAIAVSGRNHTHRRFNLFVPAGTDLGKAALSTMRSDLDVTSAEMMFDWEAEASTELDHEQRTRIAAELEASPEQIPDGRIYEIYGVGLRRPVIERNVDDLSLVSKRIAGIQSKTLALSAAANELSAIIVDVEYDTFSVIVLKNGLPEVVRESSFDPNVRLGLLAITIETEVKNAVEFAESFKDATPIEADTPVFVTGTGSAHEKFVTMLSSELSFKVAPMQHTLRAPADFSFEQFAANVGLALVAGKRFWQLTPTSMVNQPNFDLRPAQYRPRQVPVRTLAKGGIAVAAAAGLFLGYQVTNSRLDDLDSTRAEIASMETYADQVSTLTEELRSARQELASIQQQDEALQAETEMLRVRDNGFADTLESLFNDRPENVFLLSASDSGDRVNLEVAGTSHDAVLDYIDELEERDNFLSVHVDRLNQNQSVIDGEPNPAAVTAIVQITRLAKPLGT